MTEPVSGLAFIGCGKITRQHSRTLRSVDAAVPQLFASRDADKAAGYAASLGGVGHFGSYHEAMTDSRVSVVMIGTPPDSHFSLVMAALERGRDVIVEKPAFLTSAEGVQVAAAAAKVGRLVLVAENYFYKPLRKAVARVIESGRLGSIRFVHLNALKLQRTSDWRADPAVAGGGALFEGGVHWINFMANLGLRLVKVQGFQSGAIAGAERSTLVVGRYAEGAVATLHHSWEIPSLLKGLRLSRISGTAGSLTFESNGLIMVEHVRGIGVSFPGLRDIRGVRAMFTDFLEALRRRRAPQLTLEMAIEDLRILEAALAPDRDVVVG